jgi:hypothetical protein
LDSVEAISRDLIIFRRPLPLNSDASALGLLYDDFKEKGNYSALSFIGTSMHTWRSTD